MFDGALPLNVTLSSVKLLTKRLPRYSPAILDTTLIRSVLRRQEDPTTTAKHTLQS